MARTKGAVAVRETRPLLEEWMVIEACARLRKFSTAYKIHQWIRRHYTVRTSYRAVSDMLWAMRGGAIQWMYTTGGNRTVSWYRIHPAYIPADPIPDPYTAEQRATMLENLRRQEAEDAARAVRKKQEKREYDRRRRAALKRTKRRFDALQSSPDADYRDLDAVADLLRADRTKVLVVDVETTGLDAYSDDVLELAVADMAGNTVLYRRFGSTLESWDEAERIHGIRPADVDGLQDLESCAEEISGILAGASLILGYNVGFDLNFIHAAGVTTPAVPVCDIMAEYAEYNGEWIDWAEPCGDWKWVKLTVAARHCGASTEGAHNARVDCELTARVTDYLLALPPEERHREPPPGCGWD